MLVLRSADEAATLSDPSTLFRVPLLHELLRQLRIVSPAPELALPARCGRDPRVLTCPPLRKASLPLQRLQRSPLSQEAASAAAARPVQTPPTQCRHRCCPQGREWQPLPFR